MRVLSIGECMVEMSPTEHPGTYSLGFAGDAFNTAWYVRALSETTEVCFFTAVGRDRISDQMREFFVESQIDDRFVSAVEGQTVGLYLIGLAQGERHFTYWRANSAARRLADDPGRLRAALDWAKIVYFSGISLAILAPERRQALLTSIAAARAAGRRVCFDTNLRPALWSAPEEMMRATMAGAAVADVILPSFDDEARWFGDSEPAKTVERYAAQGATTVIVKNGSDDVHFRAGGQSGSVSVPPADAVVDTTAAGDSFNAGILLHLDGSSPKVAIERASRIARQVIGARGALVRPDAGV